MVYLLQALTDYYSIGDVIAGVANVSLYCLDGPKTLHDHLSFSNG